MTIKTHVNLARWILAGAITIGAFVATANDAQARKGMSLFLTNSVPSTCDIKAGMVGYLLSGPERCEVWTTAGATAFTPCPPAVNQFDVVMATDWHVPATIFRFTSAPWPGTAQVTYNGTGPAISGCAGVNATATGTANN
jgi:hypothetical protein